MNSFLIKQNLIEDSSCYEIISKYKSQINETSFTNANATNSVRELVLKGEFWDARVSGIVDVLNSEVEQFLSKFHISSKRYYFSHAVLWHQTEMNSIPVHYDTEWVPESEGDQPIRNFACLLYLNGDFEGGEVSFPLHNISLKPEPGLLLIFPTSFMFPHFTSPSIGNDRYVMRLNYFIDKPRAYEQYSS